ncbi:outer membrane protein assembly factor BamC [Methylotetracoccus oryzae]|uniref:outer membrane protein assembly factor BamC n=1 Tax=Methylotetracoccus oryzae TaxID=1919059 RepID=UPI0011194F85|nr:outer membrane protein assembly factor BamC [Methylotetracoccus oryzae]
MNRPLIVASVASSLVLSGCSFLGSLFPDKQRQYQYTTEIPPLEVPPDLSMSTMTGAKINRGAGPAAARDTVAPAEGEDEATPRPAAAGGPAEPKTPTLAQNTEDVPLIELSSPFAQAWNDVGRALGRLKVEVSDQNRSEGVYYVYYGGPAKAYEDRGMWGDISDLFSGDSPKAKEFRLKLEEHKTKKGASTDVFLFDDEGQPVTGGPSLELLKKLHAQLTEFAKSDSGAATGPSSD